MTATLRQSTVLTPYNHIGLIPHIIPVGASLADYGVRVWGCRVMAEAHLWFNFLGVGNRCGSSDSDESEEVCCEETSEADDDGMLDDGDEGNGQVHDSVGWNFAMLCMFYKRRSLCSRSGVWSGV